MWLSQHIPALNSSASAPGTLALQCVCLETWEAGVPEKKLVLFFLFWGGGGGGVPLRGSDSIGGVKEVPLLLEIPSTYGQVRAKNLRSSGKSPHHQATNKSRSQTA